MADQSSNDNGQEKGKYVLHMVAGLLITAGALIGVVAENKGSVVESVINAVMSSMAKQDNNKNADKKAGE